MLVILHKSLERSIPFNSFINISNFSKSLNTKKKYLKKKERLLQPLLLSLKN